MENNKLPHHTTFQQLCCNIIINPSHRVSYCSSKLPGWGFGRGLPSVVEYTGAWPSAKHGGSGAFPPGESQINVRLQEPGVGVLFHQAVDFHLSCFKTALCGLCHIVLDGRLGVIVNVDLNEKIGTHVKSTLAHVHFNPSLGFLRRFAAGADSGLDKGLSRYASYW